MKLSIVSPVYRAEAIVDELVKRIDVAVSKLTNDYEIILVEDCGPDNSWQAIERNCAVNKRLKGIKLSRNFGQHYAITAGIDHSSGDYVIVLDCDLQDDPNDFEKLLDKAKEGFEVVFTTRLNRQHNKFRSALSWLYKKFYSFVSEKRFAVNNGSLFLISRKVVEATKQLKEGQRLIGQIIRWVGFPTAYVDVSHQARFSGQSSYSFRRQFSIAVEGGIAHSDKLLRISIYLGLTFASLSFLAVFIIIFMYFYQGSAVGWASVITSILFSTGLILISIGISGLYIGKIFDQVKGRPLYIVHKIIN
jgi:glycosyltransferase involved in cell wall biosynthesis